MRNSWKFVLSAAILAAGLSAPAQAGLLPVSTSVYQEDNGSYRYTYGVVLTSDSTLKSGDYFTVYDFSGYVDGSATSSESGWTVTASNSGSTPSGINSGNDENTVDLTWTYTGEDKTGQVGVGNFSANSTNAANDGTTTFVGQTHTASGQSEGVVTQSTGPSATTDDGAAQTPEPATLVLLGLALPFAGVQMWRRRRHAAAE